MPTLLSDPSRSVYLLLGVFLIIAVAVWLNKSSRQSLIAAIICGSLLGLIYLLDTLLESPREQAVRKMRELAQATQTNNAADITRHFSDRFLYGSTTKKQIADKFQKIRSSWSEWRGGEVWGFDRDSYQELSETQLKIGFTGQAKGYVATQHYLVATFQKEADGEWRILKVAFYDPLQKDRGGEKMMPELGN